VGGEGRGGEGKRRTWRKEKKVPFFPAGLGKRFFSRMAGFSSSKKLSLLSKNIRKETVTGGGHGLERRAWEAYIFERTNGFV